MGSTGRASLAAQQSQPTGRPTQAIRISDKDFNASVTDIEKTINRFLNPAPPFKAYPRVITEYTEYQKALDRIKQFGGIPRLSQGDAAAVTFAMLPRYSVVEVSGAPDGYNGEWTVSYNGVGNHLYWRRSKDEKGQVQKWGDAGYQQTTYNLPTEFSSFRKSGGQTYNPVLKVKRFGKDNYVK